MSVRFSPLSLTQTLPFLPLAQGDIDYQTSRRGEPDLIRRTLDEPGCTVILTRNGQVGVPRGQGELADRMESRMRLATLPGRYVADDLEARPGAVAMFLGGYDGARGGHVVAVDITRLDDPGSVPTMTDTGTVDGRMGPGRATAANGVPDSATQGADDAFDDAVPASQRDRGPLARAADRLDWVDLRGFAPHASAREAGQATSAVALGLWHVRQRHCPTCGAPVVPAMGGWAQRCTGRDDGRRLLFPRVEPAVITAIVDRQGRLLLQHNAAWQDDALYSVSAGFVEAGENLEHACRREALEETGVRLGEVRYLGSQPWPYPASLMVAFKALALTDDIRVDGAETTDARWMTREDYERAVAEERIVAPGRATIARYMIEEWLGHGL